MNGFDKYLEYQFHWSGSFYTHLFEAIQCADGNNLGRLAKGFPEEVEAYKVWTRVGREEFLAGCSQDHSIIRDIKNGKYKL
jgi:hypothetical protein